MERSNAKKAELSLKDIKVVDDFTIDDLVQMAMVDDSWESDQAKRMQYVRGIFMANASIL